MANRALKLFSTSRTAAPPKVKPQQALFPLEPIQLSDELAKELETLKKKEDFKASSYKLEFLWETGLFQEVILKLGKYPFKLTILKSPTLGDVLSVTIRPTGLSETAKHVLIRWRFDIVDTDYKNELLAIMDRDGAVGNRCDQVIASADEKKHFTMYITVMAIIYP